MCGSSIPVMTLNPDLVVSNAIPEVVYTRYVRLGEGYVLGHEARILGVGPVDDSSASHEVCVGMETEPTHYSRVKQITSEALVSSQQPHEASPDTALNFALSHEQQQLVDLIGKGNNVFYTGSAGTGKSTVLRAFVADFERQGKVVVKVAPTGVAALNIGGQTYFKFAGWAKGSQKRSLQMLENGARTQHKRWKRLNEADVLVIDEVSMMDAHQLDRLDRVCRAARQPSEELQGWEEYHGGQARSPHDPSMPFGGMQIIVTGDFCQLPPVLPFTTCFPCGKTTDDLGHGTRRCEPCDKIFRDGDEWAFKSSAWKACNFTNVQLMSVHRQVDADFVAILQSLRAGQCPSPSQLRLLLDHPCQTEGAIKLFPRKQEAQAENYKRLQEIPLQAIVYNCIDHTTSQVALPHPDSLYEQLALKKGMLVMNIINGPDGSGIVNGSQGQLLDFLPFEHARLDADAADEADRLPLARGDHARYRDGMIRKWMRLAPGALLPYVQFFTGQRAVIFPVCDVEEIGDEEPYILSSRTQLPLLPAWAISVHKSQGMTLDRVFIDIDRSFKDEMAYVALSRARSLYGLEVRSANGLAKLRTARRNPVVHKFLEDCFGEQRNGLANHTQ
jgi:ATP-dependent DNA helicase PIF1